MSLQASSIDLSSLEQRLQGIRLAKKDKWLKLKNLFNMTDEIDVLAYSFNEMLSRLNLAFIELEKTRESLTQTEKLASVGTVAAGLAHEINNPLAGMSNCLRRISEKPNNIDQNLQYINLMSEAIEKISSVVTGLLDFSRKHEMNFSKIDLIKLIENSISLINFQIRQAHINLVREYEYRNLYIVGSGNHLEQVFVNLLLNSIDAINEKAVSIKDFTGTIKINIRKDRKSVTIEFVDNGMGLDPSKIPLMFEPFFTDKKVKLGTGLGLAVSSDIINKHNGVISGKNAPDGGFIVTISIPNGINVSDTNN